MKNKKYKRLAKRIIGECIRRDGYCLEDENNDTCCKYIARPCWRIQFNIGDISSIKTHGIRRLEKAIKEEYHIKLI